MGICFSVRMVPGLLNGSFLTGHCDRSLSVGLTNGGFAGLWWVFLGTVTCYSTIVASLAEMESMAPTSGGMYSYFRTGFWD
jgi:amino acid transporter